MFPSSGRTWLEFPVTFLALYELNSNSELSEIRAAVEGKKAAGQPKMTDLEEILDIVSKRERRGCMKSG